MSGQELVNELSSKIAIIDKALSEFGNRGRVYAKSEQEYRQALSKKILLEREKGTPATIMSDVCRGDREIAKLKFKERCCRSSI